LKEKMQPSQNERERDEGLFGGEGSERRGGTMLSSLMNIVG